MSTIVARFEIQYTQFLNEHGQCVAELPNFAQDFSVLVNLYQTMLKTRLFDKKAIALQRTGKMGTYPPITGQEAISTAIGHAMHPEDVLIPYYRDYAAQFQRGVTMSDIFSYWGGDERGNVFEHCVQDLPMSVPIASQCLHATGIAFAFQYRQEPRVAVISLGDGATSEGDFYEAMNIAGCWRLPVVFVINNNQWAISVPLSQQTAAQTLAQKAIAAGFEGRQVDGNDVIALRHCLGEAVEKARRQEGPTLIEALTYRLSDHTTADDATRYQPQADVQKALYHEPCSRLKTYLIAHHHWSEAQERAYIEAVQQDIETAVSHYLQKKPQSIASMFDYHYATLPSYLIEQRALAIEEETYHA